MFNKVDYLNKSLWKSDDFLMKPDGSKCCKVCDKHFYAVEFIDYDEFADGKLPVCNKCLRSTSKGNLSRSVIDESCFIVTCEKCGILTGLGQMGMSYAKNKVSKICWNCAKQVIKEAYK